MQNNAYIVKSDRLGFRNWKTDDVRIMSEINSDPRVMEFFPTIQSEKQTIEFIIKMQNQFATKGFCYFAVDKLDDQELIGFIGLSEQNFSADFTPCIDVGWRLKATEWNKGYATEGAKRCLEYAFNELNIDKVNAFAPKVNIQSERVMNKIGMTKVMNFKHPLLDGHNDLEDCILYEILNNNTRKIYR